MVVGEIPILPHLGLDNSCRSDLIGELRGSSDNNL